MTATFEKLAASNIQLLSLAGLEKYFVFERDGCVAFVARKEDGFGSIGAPGILTDHGLAVLVWRESQAYFAAKGYEQPATREQVKSVRAFAADLQAALNSSS